MRKLCALLVAVLLAATVWAQIPQKMSYQAVIRNSSNALVTNTQVGMQVSILLGSPSGTVVYTQTQTPTTNANGLVSIEIGDGTGYNTIDWANGIYFIKTETDPTGGTNYVITGTSQLLSVPYALYAKKAESAENGITHTQSDAILANTAKISSQWTSNGSDINYNTGGVGIGISTPYAKLHVLSNSTPSYPNISISENEEDFARLGLGNNVSSKFWTIAAFNSSIDANQDIVHFNHTTGGNVFSIGKTQLTINTPVKINDGTQGSGKVLTSNANGLASWQTPAVIGAHNIGENYGGGIVFYVYDNGQHGLIASTTDQSTGIQWYNGTYRFTGTTGDGLHAGAMNTAMIVASQIADNQAGNFAAKVCADYSITVAGVSYGDWYLPSNYELNLLFLQKTVVGGFANGVYWNSNEYDSGVASTQNFNGGYVYSSEKNATNRVRAIRSF